MPTVEQIIAGVRTAQQLIETYYKLKDTLSSTDREAVERELEKLQATNDSLFVKVDKALGG